MSDFGFTPIWGFYSKLVPSGSLAEDPEVFNRLSHPQSPLQESLRGQKLWEDETIFCMATAIDCQIPNLTNGYWVCFLASTN